MVVDPALGVSKFIEDIVHMARRIPDLRRRAGRGRPHQRRRRRPGRPPAPPPRRDGALAGARRARRLLRLPGRRPPSRRRLHRAPPLLLAAGARRTATTVRTTSSLPAGAHVKRRRLGASLRQLPRRHRNAFLYRASIRGRRQRLPGRQGHRAQPRRRRRCGRHAAGRRQA